MKKAAIVLILVWAFVTQVVAQENLSAGEW